MDEAIKLLRSAVNRLARVDPSTLNDEELHHAVVSVQCERERLGAVAAGLVSQWDQRRVWAGDGSRSAASRLAREVHSGVDSAKVELRRARHLRTMPATREAVMAGRLSLDHVDLLGRANRPWRDSVFADEEALLVEGCAPLPFADAARFVSYWCQRADAGGAADAGERQRAGAHLYASATLDGEVAISGMLDPVGGAVVVAELAKLEREQYLADRQKGVTRTPAQRRAASLVEMAIRSASAAAARRRPRPLFTVLLGDESFRALCELSNGTVITPSVLLPWGDDALLESVLFDGRTTVVSVSHRRRFVGAVRRAIEVRDRRCQHPSGCDVPVDGCDIDHIVPVVRHGATSQFNGRLECPTHNRHADQHDHGAVPYPPRAVTRLDELRVKIRWRGRDLDRDDEPDAVSR